MTPSEFAAALGREISATDHPPGLYTTRKPGRKSRDGKPGSAVRIVYDLGDGYWYCVVNGEETKGSGVRDPLEIPFILYNAPFWPATREEYDATLNAALDYAAKQEEIEHEPRD